MKGRYFKQLRVILSLETIFIATLIYLITKFWGNLCGGEFNSCFERWELNSIFFLFISAIRPLLLTPLNIFAVLAGQQFGIYWGTFLTAVGATLSCSIIYGLSHMVGVRYIRPWLSANLPMTYQFLHSQDWKIVLATRFIPLLPFDLLSLIYGFLNFRKRYVLLLSFLGSLPEIFIFAQFGQPDLTITKALLKTLLMVGLFFLSPGLLIEYRERKKGGGMWIRLKEMWKELLFEIRMTNFIIREKKHDPTKIPIFLVYGFFSSRKTLTILGHQLEQRGYEVITFNLGGLFGVFSTKGIPESAESINIKLMRYLQNHKIDKLNIIAHSNGGLVAFWWLLRLNGHRYCNKLITLGTPFQGTYLTWLSFITPFGFFMPDMWQMGPGSSFLQSLREIEIPEDLFIYNVYSDNDSVAQGERGVLRSVSYKQVHPIAMHHVFHEDFLKRRDVCDTLAYILGSPNVEPDSPADQKKNEAKRSIQEQARKAS